MCHELPPSSPLTSRRPATAPRTAAKIARSAAAASHGEQCSRLPLSDAASVSGSPVRTAPPGAPLHWPAASCSQQRELPPASSSARRQPGSASASTRSDIATKPPERTWRSCTTSPL
eukprot:2382932-Prymnesium_polylepis.1